MNKEMQLKAVEWGILGAIPTLFTFSQLMALYLNFLYFGEIIVGEGLMMGAVFLGSFSIGGGIALIIALIPLRKSLEKQVRNPF